MLRMNPSPSIQGMPVKSKLVAELHTMTACLPISVPIVNPDDQLASFTIKPIVDPTDPN
jgi:hypothetical protein